MPEHRPRRLFLQMEQVQFLADAPMIALFRFFQSRQVFLELLFVGPGGAVDPLQHFIVGIAPPVGAGHLHQFEGLELAGAGNVRAPAQVLPIALAI